MTSRQLDRQHDQPFWILQLWHEAPELSQQEIARRVGISVGGIYHTLTALIDKGVAKTSNFTAAKDRRPHAYVLTPKRNAEKSALTYDFLKRKHT